LELGYAYYYGDRFKPVDEEKGKELIIQAAREGSLCAVADCYVYGWDGKTVDYKVARQLYKMEADSNMRAATNLGDIYANGQGAEKSFKEAEKWYKKAIELGRDTVSLYNLALLYHGGADGVEKDTKKYISLVKEAALQGHSGANVELGEYEYGQNNLNDSIAYFKKAAAQGQPEALFYLGTLCRRRVNGLRKSKAYDYFERAAEQGHFGACNIMGNKHYRSKGNSVEDKIAWKWYSKAAKGGNAAGNISLGSMLEDGRGPSKRKDYFEALERYKKAAEIEDEDEEQTADTSAWTRLADIYFKGRTCSSGTIGKNFEMAADYFEKGAKKQDARAMSGLGHCYLEGKGREKNHAQALIWFEKAAKKNIFEALLCSADLYYEGANGVVQDLGKAVKYYHRAMEHTAYKQCADDQDIEFKVAQCYLHGSGVERDFSEAMRFMKLSSNHGGEKAKQFLREIAAEPKKNGSRTQKRRENPCREQQAKFRFKTEKELIKLELPAE